MTEALQPGSMAMTLPEVLAALPPDDAARLSTTLKGARATLATIWEAWQARRLNS